MPSGVHAAAVNPPFHIFVEDAPCPTYTEGAQKFDLKFEI